jgi:hypothetical protein
LTIASTCLEAAHCKTSKMKVNTRGEQLTFQVNKSFF